MNYDFVLKNGIKVKQTSKHGIKFSDGTIFQPSENWIKETEKITKLLTAKREFTPIPGFLVKTTKSTQSLDIAGLEYLETFRNKRILVLVSFMVLAALKEMGIRDKFPFVVGINATFETSRNKLYNKVYDVENFAY